MPSPFPGMNPYIEQPAAWQDFHSRFIPIAAEKLTAQVFPRYYVKIGEHLSIRELSAEERFSPVRPDFTVQFPPVTPVPPASPGPKLMRAPASVGMPAVVEKERIPYLEIIDRASRKVVTVVELLSPSHKQVKSDRDQYLAKVQRILASDVNLVEIDLLRGGPRMPWADLPACDYYVIISRPEDRKQELPRAGLWPLRLREPIPTIPIPLRPGEEMPSLDIQAIIHHIHDAAAYRLFIYESDPVPPLSAADAAWAAQLLAQPEPTA
jgi:hypothetical protein